MGKPRAVRINGLPYLVPEGWLMAPFDDDHGPYCGASEPFEWGAAPCTLPPHDPAIMHIASNCNEVIAMWAEGLGADPHEHLLSADIPDRAWVPRPRLAGSVALP